MNRQNVRRILVLFVLCIASRAAADETDRSQAAAIKAVRALGGEVWFESEWNGSGTPPTKRKAGVKPKERPTEGQVVALSFDVYDFVEFELDDLVGYQDDSPVKDAELRWLEAFPKLHWLNLYRTGVTSEGLQRLARLKSLRTLKLSETKLSDAAVDQLASLSQLASVDVRATKLTAAGAERLQRRLPNAVIRHEGNPVLALLASAVERSEKWQWQTSSDGKLSFRLSTNKLSFDEGEPIIVTLKVVNVSDETINFASPLLPNSPTGFFLVRLDEENRLVDFETSRKGGEIVELKPKQSHSIQFALGQQAKLPGFDEFSYSRSVYYPSAKLKTNHLRQGEYHIDAWYSGRRYGVDESVKRVNHALQERNIWPGTMRFSLSFTVRSDGKPEPANRVDSLTCEISVDRAKYEAGDTMLVTRRMRNHSDEPREIHGFNFMNDTLFFHWIDRRTGKRSIQPFSACGVPAPHKLGGGATEEKQLKYTAPAAGEYDFYISCEVTGSDDRLISNSLRITIAPSW